MNKNSANPHPHSAPQANASETSSRMMQLAMQASISQLVNAVAHQINNSLTPILGYSQLLQEEDIAGDESRLYLKRISEEAENLSKIIDNMLTFTRRRNLGREITSINSLLKETVALQAYEIEKRDIAIRFVLDPDLPLTVVDQFQMQVVFLSIIQNAFEALSDHSGGGKIVVLTRPAPRRARFIQIQFTDNGPGIDPRIQPEVFGAFFTTKTRAQNSIAGLGLTICQHLLEKHNGRIAVRSELGCGTAVLLDIPVVQEELARPEDDASGIHPEWS